MVLPFPVLGFSVHISLTSTRTMLQWRSNAFTRPNKRRLFRQLIRTWNKKKFVKINFSVLCSVSGTYLRVVLDRLCEDGEGSGLELFLLPTLVVLAGRCSRHDLELWPRRDQKISRKSSRKSAKTSGQRLLFWFDRRAPDEKCNTTAGILRIHGGQKLLFYYDAIDKEPLI